MDNNTFFKDYMSDAAFDPSSLKTEDDLKNIPLIHANLRPLNKRQSSAATPTACRDTY